MLLRLIRRWTSHGLNNSEVKFVRIVNGIDDAASVFAVLAEDFDAVSGGVPEVGEAASHRCDEVF